MTRTFSHYLGSAMLFFWLTELGVFFALGFSLLNAGVAGDNPGAAGEAAVLALSAVLTSFLIGLYRPETFLRLRRLMAKTLIAGVLSFPAVWLIARLFHIDFGVLLGHGALLPAKLLLAWIVAMVVIRLAFSYSLRMNLFSRRIVIVGDTEGAARTKKAIKSQRNRLFDTVGLLGGADASQTVTDLVDQLRRHRIWGVVVVGSDDALAERVALALRQNAGGITVWRDREFWEGQLRRVDIDQCIDAASPGPCVFTGQPSALRRVSDVVLCLSLLFVTLPVMLLAAAAIKLDGRGPVLYRQERVGLNGHAFTLYKFRSMRTDAEAAGPVWAAQRDSRVTRIGAIMRQTRIDELPQLFNILCGEMSFIGPRPERPHFVEKLAGVIPMYRERNRVKPGLTGWAQVNYPYGASVEDARMKLSYDLYYVKRRSLILDVLILFSTVRVILFQEGAR
jgi:sugar transferase (PEP-CTERM system associated)